MDAENIYRSIFKRRSVRQFENAPLDEVTFDSIRTHIASLRPLFPEIRTHIELLAGEPVKGLFKVNAPYYLAFYSEEKEGHLINSGFMLQQMDLFCNSNGIGSCWLGLAKPAKTREAGLECIIVLAFGRAAGEVDRRVADFRRKPLTEITNIQGQNELLEAGRLAPSAMNHQSWFFTLEDGRVDVHHERSLIYYRFNQINSGIALFHLLLAAQHAGLPARVSRIEGVAAPKGYAYSASLLTR